jgi:DNA-binding NarL/FixJ family response regulator
MHGNDQKRFEINAVADKTLIADLSDSRRKILFMLRSDSSPKIVEIKNSGAVGCMLKSSGKKEFENTLRSIMI